MRLSQRPLKLCEQSWVDMASNMLLPIECISYPGNIVIRRVKILTGHLENATRLTRIGKLRISNLNVSNIETLS